jgi:uncharacterized protein (DUF1800 family)
MTEMKSRIYIPVKSAFGFDKAGKGITKTIIVCALAASFTILSACGGGGESGKGSITVNPPVVAVRPTEAEASRFLAQATFGPIEIDLSAVTSTSYADWLNGQLSMPVSSSHLSQLDARLADLKATNTSARLSPTQFYESFWLQAVTAPDGLRQRVKFALSEIFVVSLNSNIDVRGVASYYDMLGRNSFGNFRTLLEDVTYHPAMGIYLTYLANQKENTTTGRSADENYAREIMQLFTIGLFELNADGSSKTDVMGKKIPAYTNQDISGLAKVFTGLSWYNATPSNSTFWGANRDLEAYTRPMITYNNYHSISAKTFLGTTIPATTTPDAGNDVKIALDTLFNHPNTPPFFSELLIQRLVTSNPSRAYVGRVSAVFKDNGSGLRGDMSAVIRAVLLDREARTVTSDPTAGKLREPVVRLAHFMRSFKATSASGKWLMTTTSGNTSISQSPLNSPSVFNFFRPGYVPPNTNLGSKNKVAPEFQITDEVTAASYVNTMHSTINAGIGTGNDIKSTFSKEAALADNPEALIRRIDTLLYGGQMSDGLKTKLVAAVNSVPLTGTQAQIDSSKLNRAKLAVFLGMSSSEYLAQR